MSGSSVPGVKNEVSHDIIINDLQVGATETTFKFQVFEDGKDIKKTISADRIFAYMHLGQEVIYIH